MSEQKKLKEEVGVKTITLSLTPPQRNFLVVNFKDEFENVEIVPNQRFFKRLGPTIQALFRDAIDFHFKYSPIIAEVRTEQVTEKITRDFYKFELPLEIPGVKHEIKLSREIAKDVLERQ